jgi:hypothetical protein
MLHGATSPPRTSRRWSEATAAHTTSAPASRSRSTTFRKLARSPTTG